MDTETVANAINSNGVELELLNSTLLSIDKSLVDLVYQVERIADVLDRCNAGSNSFSIDRS